MENLSRKEIIEKTFDEMPREFSSHDFVQALVKNGMEYKKIQTYMYQDFLINKCIRYSSKIWRKLPLTMNEQVEAHRDQFLSMSTVADFKRSELATTDQVLDLFKSIEEKPKTITYSATISLEKRIEEAIAILKANGYKIYKIREDEV